MSVMGQGFVSDSEVTYRGKAFPATLVSPDQLTVRITKSDIATTDANSELVVVNPPPGGWTSPNSSNVQVNPKPSERDGSRSCRGPRRLDGMISATPLHVRFIYESIIG